MVHYKTYIIITLFSILSLSLSSTSTECNAISSVTTANQCTSITIETGKTCCYLEKGDTKSCKAITTSSNEEMMKEIKEETPDFITCGTETKIEKCYNIINPTEKLACTGREVEEPYSCCYMKMDDQKKRCYPFEEGKNKTLIEECAEKYKGNNNLENTPSVVCEGSIIGKSLLTIGLLFFGLL